MARNVTSKRVDSVHELCLQRDRLPIFSRPIDSQPDLRDFIGVHRDEVADAVDTAGAILLRDFSLMDVVGFERLAQFWFGELMEYQDRATKRHHVQGRVYTSTDTPSHYRISPHNENSFAARWPGRLLFYCRRPADEGGRTPLTDVREVYQRITPEIRRQFEEHGVMYVRNFGRGPGMSWQEAFGTDDPVELERRCQQDDIELEWLNDGRLRTRQVRPATARHPDAEFWVWFNHAVALHVSSLEPMLGELLLRQFGEDNLPHNSYYGDGSVIEPQVMQHLQQVHREATHTFEWQPGDLLLLDNMRVAHAREPYRGERDVVIAMSWPMAWRTIDGGRGETRRVTSQNNGSDAFAAEHGSVESVDVDHDNAELAAATQLLAKTAAEILDIPQVSPDDDLFDLHADSMSIMRIIARVLESTGIELPIRSFFETPTVAQLAQLLAKSQRPCHR